MSESTRTGESAGATPSEVSGPGRTRSVRVHLAEAPTDVLVWLAQRPGQAFTVAEIAAEVAPPDADLPLAATASALATLRAGDYVLRRVEDKRWEVTAEGRAAVVAAMTPARGSSTKGSHLTAE